MSKSELLTFCKNTLELRIKTAKDAMEDAQDSANSEEKSSAGDKYETSRALGQINRDMNAKQLVQAVADMKVLEQINTNNHSPIVGLGSLVTTNKRTCFIAIGLGNVEFQNKKLVIISSQSPLAVVMKGKKKGDTFTFNGAGETITGLS